jgi:hypothetical protein
VLCIKGVEGFFFLSSFHNASFFFLPSCLFMCLLQLPTSHVCFAYFTSFMSLLCLPCVHGCLPPLPICCFRNLLFPSVACLLFFLPHVLTLCACSCLLCLLCVLVSLAHFVTCFMCSFATYSHLRHCCHL